MNYTNLDDTEEFFLEAFRTNHIQVIFGAGFTCNEQALYGTVPSGTSFRDYMISELLKNNEEFGNYHLSTSIKCSENFVRIPNYFELLKIKEILFESL